MSLQLCKSLDPDFSLIYICIYTGVSREKNPLKQWKKINEGERIHMVIKFRLLLSASTSATVYSTPQVLQAAGKRNPELEKKKKKRKMTEAYFLYSRIYSVKS